LFLAITEQFRDRPVWPIPPTVNIRHNTKAAKAICFGQGFWIRRPVDRKAVALRIMLETKAMSKKSSKPNALKHGATSQEPMLWGEKQEDYDALRDGL
jgi:hypothetical protein